MIAPILDQGGGISCEKVEMWYQEFKLLRGVVNDLD